MTKEKNKCMQLMEKSICY